MSEEAIPRLTLGITVVTLVFYWILLAKFLSNAQPGIPPRRCVYRCAGEW